MEKKVIALTTMNFSGIKKLLLVCFFFVNVSGQEIYLFSGKDTGIGTEYKINSLFSVNLLAGYYNIFGDNTYTIEDHRYFFYDAYDILFLPGAYKLIRKFEMFLSLGGNLRIMQGYYYYPVWLPVIYQGNKNSVAYGLSVAGKIKYFPVKNFYFLIFPVLYKELSATRSHPGNYQIFLLGGLGITLKNIKR